jgi:hypothetical protein
MRTVTYTQQAPRTPWIIAAIIGLLAQVGVLVALRSSDSNAGRQQPTHVTPSADHGCDPDKTCVRVVPRGSWSIA